MPCVSATMTVWVSAWLGGVAAPDDVLDALDPWGEAHEVLAADDATARSIGLPGPADRPTSVTFLLAALRRTRGATTGPVRLVLAAPGDLRGLPGPGPFSRGVVRAGQGLLFPDIGYGLVPAWLGGEGLVRWTVYSVLEPVTPDEHVALGAAESGLRDQVRRSTSTLTGLGVARHRPGVREEIAATLRARPRSLWPEGMPARDLRVLRQADEVEAILVAASADDPGGALSASAAQARTDALRPLATAVRVARRAAVADAVRALAGSSDRA